MGPMTETSNAHGDEGPHRASDLRMKLKTSIEPKIRAVHWTEARQEGTRVTVY
jgi:hypothetical protein